MFEHTRGDQTIYLTPLGLDDLELVMAWRSDPDIYGNLLQQDEPLEWGEHLQWFVERPPSRRDFVVRYGGRRVGVVSLNSDDMVSIYVGEKNLWGAGIGTMAVDWLCQHFVERTPRTVIADENERTRSLFETLDFVVAEERDGKYEYIYEGENGT